MVTQYVSHKLSKKAAKLALAKKFDEAIEVAEKIEDSYWRSKALSYIAVELANYGDFDKSLEVIESIGNDTISPAALKYVIEKLVESAKVGEAKKTLEIAKKIKDKGLRLSTLNRIIQLQVHKSKEVSMSKSVKKVSELIKVKKFDEAIKVAEGIEDNYWKSLALKDIAVELAKSGDFDKALDVANKIKVGYWRSWVIRKIESPKTLKNEDKDSKDIDLRKVTDIYVSLSDAKELVELSRLIESDLSYMGVIRILKHNLKNKAREYESKDVRKAIELYESIGDERAEELKKLIALSKEPVTTIDQLKKIIEQIKREKNRNSKQSERAFTKKP